MGFADREVLCVGRGAKFLFFGWRATSFSGERVYERFPSTASSAWQRDRRQDTALIGNTRQVLGVRNFDDCSVQADSR